jgi:hypothetical protein
MDVEITVEDDYLHYYYYYKGKSKLFKKGKCVSGPDRGIFILTLVLILLPSGLFFAIV